MPVTKLNSFFAPVRNLLLLALVAVVAGATPSVTVSSNVLYQPTLLATSVVDFNDSVWRNDSQVNLFYEGSCEINSCSPLFWNLIAPGFYTGPGLIIDRPAATYTGLTGNVHFFLLNARGTPKPNNNSAQEWPNIGITFNQQIIGVQTLTNSLLTLNPFLRSINGGNDTYLTNPGPPFFGLENEFDSVTWTGTSQIQAYLRTQFDDGGNWDQLRIGVFEPTTVPEPASITLAVAGLIALVLIRVQKQS